MPGALGGLKALEIGQWIAGPRLSSNAIRIDNSLVLEALLEARLADGRPQITFAAADNAGLARIPYKLTMPHSAI